MTRANTRLTHFGARLLHRLARFARSRDGNITPLMALMVVPIVGSFGMVMETGNWYLNQRAMQNAADTAALAASANDGTTTAASCAATPGTFDCEAKAAVAQTPLVSGANTVAQSSTATSATSTTTWASTNVTVVSTYATSGCPAGFSSCYTVTISRKLPLSLLSLVGYAGNTTIGTARAQTILATAVASGPGALTGYCMMALGTGGKKTGITINGNGGGIDLGGCDVFSNASQKCAGTNGGIGIAVSVNAPNGNQGCGTSQLTGSQYALTSDPYNDGTVRALNQAPPIPPETCGGTYAGGNLTTTATSWKNTTGTYCGNMKLSGNTCVTTANTILAISNGSLDMNGFSLATSGGKFANGTVCDAGGTGSLTIIFTGPVGTNGNGASYYPINQGAGSSTMDIAGPTSGSLAGVALYQDGRLGAGNGWKGDLDWQFNGAHSPISYGFQGLVYLPNASITIDGAIKQHTSGFACVSVVAYTMTFNGGGSIFPNPTAQCVQAHLQLPGVPGTGSRLALIQ